MKPSWIAAGILVFLIASTAWPCTIISGRTKDNVVWVGNNEDYFFDFNTYLNVLPREGDLLGAVSFTYGSPDSFIQGGFNEDGLFFDFNALPDIPKSDRKDWGKRKTFPGGEVALVEQILRRCSTVQDVINLAKEYEIKLTGAQIHLADREGNLAVINESGIRIEENNFQVSTNFNVCVPGPSNGLSCWRYPIAERMFQERGVSLDSVRDILDATQQPRFVGTIYSNVINLSTGDAYNYYAGDFNNAYQFNLNEQLKKGKKSYLWRSLFPDALVVRVWETYLAKGSKAAVELYRKNQDRIPQERRAEILRHVFLSCILHKNKYADAKVFFDEWLHSSAGHNNTTNLYHGLIHLTNGNVEQARQRFAEQVTVDATLKNAQQLSSPSIAEMFLDKLQRNKTPGANTRFTLKGHHTAKFVCVAGIGSFAIRNVLFKTEDGWEAEFDLPPGKYHYAFLVDGRVVSDPANPETEEIDTEDGKMTRNVIVVK